MFRLLNDERFVWLETSATSVIYLNLSVTLDRLEPRDVDGAGKCLVTRVSQLTGRKPARPVGYHRQREGLGTCHGS